MIIYKITNRINGKVYIGQTIQPLTTRWRKHCNSSSCCKYIHSAIAKYGKENFTVEQIDVACDRDELDSKEIYWINFYDSMNPEKGYNLTSGGEHKEVSDIVKKQISKNLKGKKKSLETRIKMSKAQLGKNLSETTKEKISNTLKGRIVSEETRKKQSQILKGRVFSKDHCKRISESKKGIRSTWAYKKVECIETGEIFNSMTDAAKTKMLSEKQISNVCRGVHKTCGGFHWRYADE